MIDFVFIDEHRGKREPGTECIVSNAFDQRVGTVIRAGDEPETYVCKVAGEELVVYEFEASWKPRNAKKNSTQKVSKNRRD